MPELPEVETTKRGIAPHTEGKKVKRVIIRNRQLRWPIPDELETLVEGKTLLGISRRGKYLLLRFCHGTALWHLGMSGSLRIVPSNLAPEKHDHVDWVFSQDLCLRFNDPRRFGALLWTDEPIEQHKLLKGLGPEPLGDRFTGQYLFKASRKKSKPVKTWLMDAHVVVGVGNIYANEVLFACGIHPMKKTGTLTKKQCGALYEHSKRILAAAIAQGGTTLKDFVGGDGKPGYFAQNLLVYGRGGQACSQCNTALQEIRLGQRTTVFCRACQKK